jgi:hypothetical protein
LILKPTAIPLDRTELQWCFCRDIEAALQTRPQGYMGRWDCFHALFEGFFRIPEAGHHSLGRSVEESTSFKDLLLVFCGGLKKSIQLLAPTTAI